MSYSYLIDHDNNIGSMIANIPGILGYYPTDHYILISVNIDGRIVGHSTIDKDSTVPGHLDATLDDMVELFGPNTDNTHILIHPRGDDHADFSHHATIFYDKLLDSKIPLGAIITLDAIEEDEEYTCYKHGDDRYTDIPTHEDMDLNLNGTIPPLHTTESVKDRIKQGLPIYSSLEDMIVALPMLASPTKPLELSNDLNRKIYNININTTTSDQALTLAYLIQRFISEIMNRDDYSPDNDILYTEDLLDEIDIIAGLMTILDPKRSSNRYAGSVPVAILIEEYQNIGILLDKAFSFHTDIDNPTRLCAYILRATCYILSGDTHAAHACTIYIDHALTEFDCEEILRTQPYFYLYRILSTPEISPAQQYMAIDAMSDNAAELINDNIQES